MATATKKKPPVDEAPETTSDAAPTPSYESLTVSIDAIVVHSADNPRTLFDDGALEEMAASIRQHGILQPLVVRPWGEAGKFELLDGERRYRAARHAELLKVPVRIGSLDDERAAEVRLVCNLQRADLTAMEEAYAFERLLSRFGYSQSALAEKIGVSQPHVANRLRLLKLPAVWQERIISHEIPATHARALLAFAEVPRVLEKIDTAYFVPPTRDIGSSEAFAKAVVNIAKQVLRKLDGEHYSSKLGQVVSFFEPFTVPDYERRLGVMQIDGEDYATNVELWDEKQKEYEQRLLDERDEAEGQASADLAADDDAADDEEDLGDGPRGAAGDEELEGGAEDTKEAKKRERAEAKAHAAAEREARKALDEKLAEKVVSWRTDWLRKLLADRVAGDANFALRVNVMQMQRSGACDTGRIADLLEDDDDCRGADSLQQMIARFTRPAEVLIVLATEALWQGDGPSYQLTPPEVEALAEAAGIDLEVEWAENLAGPLTETFWNLHSRDQLHDLMCVLWGWGSLPHFPATKKDAVAHVIAESTRSADNLTYSQLPAVILPVAQLAAPKARRAPRGKAKAAKKRDAKPAAKSPAKKAAVKKAARPAAKKKAAAKKKGRKGTRR